MEFLSFDIESNDFRRAGAASSAIKEHLKRIGAEAEAIRRTMIAAYEAEMNVVIHSFGGRLEACLSASQIDVNVVDGGPGIPDVEQAMVVGFSTAGAEARALGFGAGMGLPNIKRNSDRLRVTSRMGEGTRVSFTVYLQPESTDGARPISLYASADRCRDCRACLTACPTQAIRVRNGRPSVLEHLCIDCAACIAVCTSAALTVRAELSSLDALPDREDMLLVVPPALLAGCGADYRPAQVLAALQGLGFAAVATSAACEQQLRGAVVALAAPGVAAAAGGGTAPADAEAEAAPATAPGAAALDMTAPGTEPAGDQSGAPVRTPLIVPSCPAIVDLIELRFPSLVPHLAPFDSPWEALQAAYGDRPVAFTVSCPAERSALLAHAAAPGAAALNPGGAATEYLTPDLVHQAVMMKLTGGDAPAAVPAASGAGGAPQAPAPAAAGATDDPVLTVTGADHVIAVLEALENGLLGDVEVIEPYACEGGCFGSPLLAEDHHVAARRWDRGRAAVEAVEAASGALGTSGAAAGGARPRRRPFAARPGIRLDADMAKAIRKLGQMQQFIRTLPGRDCGACGAPTCAALAEDIVMQRAGMELCPYAATDNGGKEDRDR